MMTKATKLREMLKGKRPVYVMGAHNALSAKIAEKNGFDAIWASGLEISASYGVPDANILTMTQYFEKSSEMNEAVSLPIVSDCDTGYGNSNNVIHLVKKYESAGIASVCLEDKMFPKVNSFIDGRQELAPIAEFVGKIMAAKSVQRDENFFVIARIEALIAGWDEKEALLRAHKYVEAGADAVLIHSKRTDYSEITSFAKKWNRKAPIVVVPTTYPTLTSDFTEDQLVDMGIRMVIFANHGLRASIKAMNSVMGEIRKTRTSVTVEKEITSMREVFELQGMMQMKESERRYLKTGQTDFTAVILAAGAPRDQEDLAPLLRDRPVALLDINGESLIKRNISTLTRLSANEIVVVTGYCGEQFQIDGATLIHNPDYNQKHILYSLMLAESKLKGKTLLAYGDILFDRALIERLLKCEEDIVLVGDSTFKKMNLRNKQLDLLIADGTPNPLHRSLDNNQLKKVLKIANNIPEKEAHYEFVGLALFSDKGIGNFKKICHEMKNKNHGQNGGAFTKAGIDDVFQEMINQKQDISVLEVNSGWMEIQNFENYKAACHLLSVKD